MAANIENIKKELILYEYCKRCRWKNCKTI